MKICRSLLILSLLACSASAFGQSTSASITGLVDDPSKAVIAGVSIMAINTQTGVKARTTTNHTGQYVLSGLNPGSYRVEVDRQGFKGIIEAGLILHVQDVVQLNFHMAIGSAAESVTVNASALQMNTTDATVGTVVDRKFAENIPLNGRSFQDLISMTPGVVTQSPQSTSVVGTGGDFSVDGQRTQSNYYTVDGVAANISSGNGGGVSSAAVGGTLGGSTALGTTQTLISVDALQEFRVQSSTYSAAYGRSPGGQFSLVTRSGTNSFHGVAFDYLRNNFFDANDWFNGHYGKPTPALRQNDFGGTLGGPVWIPRVYNGQDRSFFFVSYEGLRLTQPTAATIQYVPDLYMRQQATATMQPILNAFPLPNGLDYGTLASPSLAQFIAPFSLPSKIDSTSIRLDHTFGSKLALFFRFSDTPSSTDSRPYFARATTTGNATTYTLGASSQFSNRFTNEFRLGYARSDSKQLGVLDNFGGATPIDLASAMGAGSYQQVNPVVILSIAAIGSPILYPYKTNTLQRQWNAVDTVSILSRQHSLKFGVDFRHIKSVLAPPNVETYAVFTSSQQILSGAPAAPYVFRFLPATPLFNQTALFAQDEWRVHPRLNLSLGLRWELNPPPTEEHGDAAYTLLGNINIPSSLSLAPQGTPLWKTSWYNFAPRLGAAWTAHNQPGMQTVVRFGGGVFFDSANEIATQGYDGVGFRAQQLYSGALLPFTPSQLNLPVTANAPYTSATVTAFPTHLQLPYTLQWNVSLQQALGSKQSITVSYVAADGRRLTVLQQKSLTALNPNFGQVFYFNTGVTSNYQALQLQFQRSVVRGVQALGSYTWAHALDYGSNSTALPLQRGNADYDVRSNFQGGVSWELPTLSKHKLIGAFLNGWGLDGRLNVRTAFPVTLGGSLLTDPTSGTQYSGGLNIVRGQAIYLYGSQYPGGKSINKAAFSLPATGASGNASRNFVRGFGASQFNLAARRDIHLHDAVVLQFRAETFNLFNHPNFGYIDPTYTDATFGQATKMLNSSLGTVASQYQQGGSRSMQFALKLLF
ncbi:TonB-dependent receptor [Terriglobus saanensis]|uniref:TonB-dependent receptor plug n=1 Tax=Terriglobus saanensis (strain ATCC BAA-1853 / DSM 23119 / SP1PR4) TaxID=401053 RepID=E8UZN1_TERSS|nr:carboxypeptidase-like regulatory domain-containing protein [Terriglobus saanensis]ADV84374.1 TonB-dependent receptor plug [Terriglobus saanensis SP1PR4]